MSISQSNLQSCHTSCIWKYRKLVEIRMEYFLIFIIKKLNYWSLTCDMSKFFFQICPISKMFLRFFIFVQRRSGDYHTWGVACVTPFGLPQFLTFKYSFRPKKTSKMLYITRETCHTLQKDLRLVFQVCILTSKEYKTVCIKH